MNLSKYSHKCYDYILNKCPKNFFDNSINYNKKYDIIDQFQKLIIETKKDSIGFKKIKSITIPKLNNKSILMHLFFLRLKELGSNAKNLQEEQIDSLYDFLSWYKNIQHDLYIPNILNLSTSYSSDPVLIELYDKMSDCSGPREKLNRLLYDNPFLSGEIYVIAEKSNLLYNTYTLDNIIIEIYIPDTKSLPHLTKITFSTNQIARLFHICKFMQVIAKKKKKSVELVLFCSNAKKRLKYQNNNKILVPENINSGSTVNRSYINIWRLEECEKVLIHELIHLFQIDFTIDESGYNDLVQEIKSKFNLEGTDKPYEAYTETVAIIIYSLYTGFYLKKDFMDIINAESKFVMFQTAKILYFFGATDINQILNKTHNSIYINQTTSVLSYFIIKCLFLASITNFLDFMNGEIYFNKKFDEFFKLINNCVSNKNIINNINLFLKQICANLNNNTTNQSAFIYRTLRMSCIELGQIN
jgi:hypothetical protein